MKTGKFVHNFSYKILKFMYITLPIRAHKPQKNVFGRANNSMSSLSILHPIGFCSILLMSLQLSHRCSKSCFSLHGSSDTDVIAGFFYLLEKFPAHLSLLLLICAIISRSPYIAPLVLRWYRSSTFYCPL